MKNNISKEINKRIFYASLGYTFIFILYDVWYKTINVSNMDTFKFAVSTFPFSFILTYIFSGTQILLIGVFIKVAYQKKSTSLLNKLSCKDFNSFLVIVLFTVVWFIMNIWLWDYLEIALKLG